MNCVERGRTKLVSWWPLPRYYEKEECGENYGYWTLARETWYIQRLNDIEAGTARPKTYTEWKTELHGQSAIRKFHMNVESKSRALF
jgi:hypothetical protein